MEGLDSIATPQSASVPPLQAAARLHYSCHWHYPDPGYLLLQMRCPEQQLLLSVATLWPPASNVPKSGPAESADLNVQLKRTRHPAIGMLCSGGVERREHESEAGRSASE